MSNKKQEEVIEEGGTLKYNPKTGMWEGNIVIRLNGSKEGFMIYLESKINIGVKSSRGVTKKFIKNIKIKKAYTYLYSGEPIVEKEEENETK